jgi:plasmid stabilization system protein ParE
MARSVKLHPEAASDIRQIIRFISERVSSRSAEGWNARIEAAIERLASEADQWPQADDAADLSIDLREMLCGRRPQVYRILFTIDGDVVNVYRIRHAAQDRLSQDDL